MKGTIKYLGDTCALAGILRGEKNYQKYTQDIVFTTEHNILELHHLFIKTNKKEYALKCMLFWLQYISPITVKSIEKASYLKLHRKKDKLSYTDCIGYELSKILGVKFLTSDSKFKNMDNVEFVEV
tara:strand:- start:1173 stop:1550 length:378 start_codon:yes stop_codon:yes gene_type:complete